MINNDSVTVNELIIKTKRKLFVYQSSRDSKQNIIYQKN